MISQALISYALVPSLLSAAQGEDAPGGSWAPSSPLRRPKTTKNGFNKFSLLYCNCCSFSSTVCVAWHGQESTGE